MNAARSFAPCLATPGPPRNAAVVLAHLRGWLAAFPPLPPSEPCDFCDGSGIWHCDDCRRSPGRDRRGGPCDACGGVPVQPCEGCGTDPVPIQIAEVLGLAFERDLLAARIARLRPLVGLLAAVDGRLWIGRAAPLLPHALAPREVVVHRAVYPHEQLPLRGLDR